MIEVAVVAFAAGGVWTLAVFVGGLYLGKWMQGHQLNSRAPTRTSSGAPS